MVGCVHRLPDDLGLWGRWARIRIDLNAAVVTRSILHHVHDRECSRGPSRIGWSCWHPYRQVNGIGWSCLKDLAYARIKIRMCPCIRSTTSHAINYCGRSVGTTVKDLDLEPGRRAGRNGGEDTMHFLYCAFESSVTNRCRSLQAQRIG